MATIHAYGVRFIGNEFVAPRNRQQPHIDSVRRHFIAAQQVRRPVAPQVRAAPVQQRVVSEVMPEQLEQYSYPQQTEQQYQQAELYAVDEPAIEYAQPQQPSFALPTMPALPKLTLPTFSRRAVIIALGSVMAIGVLALAVPRMGEIMSFASTGASELTASVNNTLKPANAQASFTMPAHSVLVKNTILSSYVDSVEGQAITINIGANVVTPLPSDIANWLKTSNGPEQGTTVLAANEANISRYVANAVLTTSKSSANSAHPVNATDASVSAAVNQITSKLLKYNSVTVNISTDMSND